VSARRAPVSYKWIVQANTTIGAFMSALDGNIVIIALPTIARELPGTSVLTLLWILLGYTLAISIVLLIFGRLSDQFGRSRLYTLGFSVFTVASLLCAVSANGLELVAFRMGQAVGAGLIFSNSAALLADAFPPNERGRALGINQVSIVAGAVSGLVVGGLLTTWLGWRWIFLVNLPIGIVASLWSHFWLRELVPRDAVPRIDWAGNLAFGAGLGAVLVAVTFGALDVVGSSEAIGLLAIGLVLLVAFVVIERRSDHPMLDLALFRTRAYTCSALAMFLSSLAGGAVSFVLVFYLQGPPHRLDPLTAGLFLVPISASVILFGPVSGILSDRFGPRGLATGGLLLSAAGFLLLSGVGPNAPFSALAPPFVLVGSGMGLFASPNRAAMMNAVPPSARGVAAGTGMTLINVGSTLSLGLTIEVMGHVMPLPSIEAFLLGSAGRPAAAPSGPFLTSVHLIFLISGVLLLAAAIPSAVRGPHSRPSRVRDPAVLV
jgi:EmrB/QacA subfamily drug resistance transporter